MLDFKRLTLDDLPFIRQHLIQSTGRFCDETPATLFMWRNYYSVAYAECANSIILRYQSGLPASAGAFSLISGNYSHECISAICDYCKMHRFPAILSTVPEETKDWLKEHYPVKTEQHDDDWADYLYDAETMIALQGSSFGGQRNHIHQFERKYPDAEIKMISPENMEDVHRFLAKLEQDYPPVDESGKQEYEMIREVLNHYDLFAMTGIVLYHEPGQIGGITLGEIQGDTLFVHVEKADKGITGIFPKLTNSYARQFADKVRYINREEDMGNPGLRRSKQSYQPIALLRKYFVELELE
jgi:hypothetical protein